MNKGQILANVLSNLEKENKKNPDKLREEIAEDLLISLD